MERPRFYRQNIISQINSVSQKSLWGCLVKETQGKYSMAPAEARLVPLKGQDLLHQISGRGGNQVEIELTAKEYSGQRQKRDDLPQRAVIITPVSSDG